MYTPAEVVKLMVAFAIGPGVVPLVVLSVPLIVKGVLGLLVLTLAAAVSCVVTLVTVTLTPMLDKYGMPKPALPP